MNKSPGRGRRAGAPDTRETIREAARARFLAEGYQDVTLRAVAADAGVDVALISYYFGSKQGLFGAAMALPVNPTELFGQLLDASADLDGFPERLLREVLATWDDPQIGAQLKTVAATAVGDPNLARVIREAFGANVVNRLAERLGPPDGLARAAAFTTQIAGLVLTRYLLRFEPIASMTIDEVVAELAPPLQFVLTGPPAAKPTQASRMRARRDGST
jgi:AcrR family transcriptional regulator